LKIRAERRCGELIPTKVRHGGVDEKLDFQTAITAAVIIVGVFIVKQGSYELRLKI